MLCKALGTKLQLQEVCQGPRLFTNCMLKNHPSGLEQQESSLVIASALGAAWPPHAWDLGLPWDPDAGPVAHFVVEA